MEVQEASGLKKKWTLSGASAAKRNGFRQRQDGKTDIYKGSGVISSVVLLFDRVIFVVKVVFFYWHYT